MAEVTAFASVLIILLALMATGLWIGVVLVLCGIITLVLAGVDPGLIVATQIWGSSSSWSLTSLPLFILMGEILSRGDIAKDLYVAMAPLFKRVPGKLAHISVAASAVFSCVSGSSTANAAIIGKMSYRELTGAGYDRGLIAGAIAAAGTLGILIPPSMTMIVYAAAADVSVIDLFLAGIVPGLLLVLCFCAYIAVVSFIAPSKFATNEDIPAHFTWRHASQALPVILLLTSIISLMMMGIATATEAAAYGVIGALALVLWRGTLRTEMIANCLISTVKTHSMIVLVLAGAGILNISMGFLGAPDMLAKVVVDSGLSAGAVIFVLTIAFLILGCFLDGLSLILLTAAIILPAIKLLGIDPIWFGIYMIIMVEVGLITPPVGLNLFVVSEVCKLPISQTAINALPYVIIMLLFVFVLYEYPSLVFLFKI